MVGETMTVTRTLVVTSCRPCGVEFAIPRDLDDKLREDGGTFYCPNGHSLSYSELTRDKLRRTEERLAEERRRVQATRDLLAKEERSHAATRGVVTRQKKKLVRVTNGVCPCCNRTFQDLRRHMKSKHPDEIVSALLPSPSTPTPTPARGGSPLNG